MNRGKIFFMKIPPTSFIHIAKLKFSKRASNIFYFFFIFLINENIYECKHPVYNNTMKIFVYYFVYTINKNFLRIFNEIRVI